MKHKKTYLNSITSANSRPKKQPIAKDIFSALETPPELLGMIPKNYAIDVHVKKKLVHGREMEEHKVLIDRDEEMVTFLKKTIPGDLPDAYVWEFYDGMPKHYRGQQLFTRNALVNLGLHTKLIDLETREAIKQNFPNVNGLLSTADLPLIGGHFDDKVAHFGRSAFVWLPNGEVLWIHPNNFQAKKYPDSPTNAFSVRITSKLDNR